MARPSTRRTADDRHAPCPLTRGPPVSLPWGSSLPGLRTEGIGQELDQHAHGSAIVLCLAELFPDHGIDLGEMNLGPRRAGRSLGERVA